MNPQIKPQNPLDTPGTPSPEQIVQPSQPTDSWIDSFRDATNNPAPISNWVEPAKPLSSAAATAGSLGVSRTARHRRPKIVAVAAVVLLAVIGSVLLLNRQVTAPAVATQAKSGQVSSSAATVADPAASAGSAATPAPAPAAAAAAPAKPTVPAGTVLFNDDFNGAAGAQPDAAKWYPYSACTYNGSAGYGSIQCGEDETLDGQGHLIIPATPSRGQSLMTGDKFKFTYGTASAWIKFPPQVGYWPAFWTLNNNASGENLPFLGEIDAMEGYTTWEDGVVAGSGYHAGFHNWSNVSGAQQTGGGPDECAKPGINLSAGYHKYTVNVAPNALSFYFDDQLCGAASYGPQNNPGAPYGFAPSPNISNGNWLILTLAVGGAGGQQKPATANAQLLVDKVQVVSN